MNFSINLKLEPAGLSNIDVTVTGVTLVVLRVGGARTFEDADAHLAVAIVACRSINILRYSL